MSSSRLLPDRGLTSVLSVSERETLSEYGEFIEINPDTTLIEEGQPQDSVYIVISGNLHAFTEKNGKRTLLSRIRAGESIGEINLYDPGVASASVLAQGYTRVWKTSHQGLEKFIEANPLAGNKLLIALITELSSRIRKTNELASFQNFWA
jgi:CRP-like cAMP-binding protein